ncbi:hypothetical protein GRX01_01705 [Halobaculum sp. WSA2]|uniref:Uncharacterized protein n=1 Tax=Halobaculum saliterrae TaxID=2073113 RepID=A0A6B0SR98_9EURY|nr:hypothetical protein [Halobaculum saliterrae]MXR40076.1 hypothetical protein [Halobaculum saliterrae]
MREDDRSWTHAGVSKIKGSGSRYVRIPDRVFREESILKPGFPVLWHYEKTVGVLIATRQELEEPNYEYSGESRNFRAGDSEYTCGIPKAFFDDFKGRGEPKMKPRAAEKIDLPRDGWLHFVFHDRMTEGSKKSCYVLTEDQFNQRFSDSDQLREIEQVPKFH